MRVQKTVASQVILEGIGVHSAQPVTLWIEPLPVDSGIVFKRVDQPLSAPILGLWSYVKDTRFCTVLGNDHGVTVSTVEHLMAAFAALGVTNALVKLSGPEVPILDGSSQPFVEALIKGGLVLQTAAASVIRILKTVTVQEGDRWARFTPGQGFRLDVTMDFHGRQGVPSQTHSFLLEDDNTSSFAAARTFGFYEDAQKLYAMGLAKGSSLDNAVVIHNGQVMNEEGLRYDNEMARHKVLDALGDLYLAGALFQGHYESYNGGHQLNAQLLNAVLCDETAWSREKTDGLTVRQLLSQEAATLLQKTRERLLPLLHATLAH